jgi:hypothetical protein
MLQLYKNFLLSGYRKSLSPFLFYDYDHSIFFLPINGKLKWHFHFIKLKELPPKTVPISDQWNFEKPFLTVLNDQQLDLSPFFLTIFSSNRERDITFL